MQKKNKKNQYHIKKAENKKLKKIKMKNKKIKEKAKYKKTAM